MRNNGQYGQYLKVILQVFNLALVFNISHQFQEFLKRKGAESLKLSFSLSMKNSLKLRLIKVSQSQGVDFHHSHIKGKKFVKVSYRCHYLLKKLIIYNGVKLFGRRNQQVKDVFSLFIVTFVECYFSWPIILLPWQLCS